MYTGYLRIDKIGEGAYATIYSAYQVESEFSKKIIKAEQVHTKKQIVAIKKIKKSNSCFGLDYSAIKEIKAFQKVKSKYVLALIDVFLHKSQFFLVLEHCESNLEKIVQDKSQLILPANIKAWLLMILKGLYEMHKKFIVHRDIKPNNILITKDGTLKIADFGLSRDIDTTKMSPSVVTRWYRAPELLMGCNHYTFSIDIWATGCVFAELFLRTPFLVGENDLGQLEAIYKILGTPNAQTWPAIKDLPNYVQFKHYERHKLKSIFTGASDDAISLLESMLVYDPSKRITVLNAIKHDYFAKLPIPKTIAL